MIRGQKLVTPNGVEVCLYGMETMTLTQGMNEGTHRFSTNTDHAGKDGGSDAMYASSTLKAIYVDPRAGHAVVYESVAPTFLACLETDYYHIRLVHDNDISDIHVGQVFPQGSKIYDEGVSGLATGNHIHMSVGRGKYKGIKVNEAGFNELVAEVDPTTIFFVNNTIMRKPIYNTWKEYKPMEIKEPKLPKMKVLASALNYRDLPDTSANGLGKLPKGAFFTYLGEPPINDGYAWAKFEIEGKIAYCATADKDGTKWIEIIEPEYSEPIDIDTTIDGVHIIIQKDVVK